MIITNNKEERMRYILTALIISTLLSAGVIHPQLVEKLKTLKNDRMLQVIVHMKNQPDFTSIPQNMTKKEKINYLQQYVSNDQIEPQNYRYCMAISHFRNSCE